MQTQRFDRIVAQSRRALAGAALAALVAGVGATALPAAAAGCGNSDADYDGLTCYQEYNYYGTDDYAYDTEGDGLGDGDEVYLYGTNPLDYDTDGDGVGDGDEVIFGTNPLVFDYGDVVVEPGPSSLDVDGDGLFDDDEFYLYGTDPYDYDTDGDLWGDGEEVWAGSDPLNRFCDPTGCG